MKIAFLENLLSIRGSTQALFDYAHYNETLLHHESIVITRPFALVSSTNHDAAAIVYEKFEARFPVFYYTDVAEIQPILDRERVDVLYILKYGRRDGKLDQFRGVKTIMHCVFDPRDPHGDVFAVISPWLNLAFQTNFPVLPHMVSLPTINDHLRTQLGIPSDAIVFGRHGGWEEFDHPVARKVVEHLAGRHPHMYFVFMNTQPFVATTYPNIFFLDKSTDPVYKTKFINTCDAMIYGRSRGETFGLAIAEFSIRNKPVFAPLHAPEMMHRVILQDRAYWYTDEDNLAQQMLAFDPQVAATQNWNMHSQYTPENVMAIFQKLIETDSPAPSHATGGASK